MHEKDPFFAVLSFFGFALGLVLILPSVFMVCNRCISIEFLIVLLMLLRCLVLEFQVEVAGVFLVPCQLLQAIILIVVTMFSSTWRNSIIIALTTHLVSLHPK